jgi:predicted permease
MTLLLSNTGWWWIALILALVAALVVAALLAVLVRVVLSIEKAVGGLLTNAAAVAENTSNIPSLAATAPVLGEIIQEAVIQDAYMNALTDGFGPEAAA